MVKHLDFQDVERLGDMDIDLLSGVNIKMLNSSGVNKKMLKSSRGKYKDAQFLRGKYKDAQFLSGVNIKM